MMPSCGAAFFALSRTEVTNHRKDATHQIRRAARGTVRPERQRLGRKARGTPPPLEPQRYVIWVLGGVSASGARPI